MKLLIVTQYFWPESFRINDLASGLRERGHEVTVLTGYPNYPEGKLYPGYRLLRQPSEQWNGIRIIRAPLVPRGSGGALRLAANYLSFALGASLRACTLRREPFDALLVFQPSPVTCGIPARILKGLTGAPILFWVQDLWPQSLAAVGAVRSPVLLGLVDRLVRWIYAGCDRILIQSRAFAETICGQGVSQERIAYFPNSAEAFYCPVDREQAAALDRELPEGFRVLFAGNIGAAQDFETILTAAELLKTHPQIVWVVIGDGRLRPWVEEEVERRGLSGRVTLVGRKPAEEMPRYFAWADLLLVTLRREPIFALTIPSKVQSYLACARPVLAALEGEGAQVLEESGGGYACPPEDPQALAETVLRMYGLTETERQAMGNNGRDYYLKQFERELLLDRLEGWLRELSPVQRNKKQQEERHVHR